MSDNQKIDRLTFSGHDTFHCRHLWLKKGYDFIKKGKKFSDEDAVVELGIGKNMVTALQYWLKAFDIIDKDNKLTDLAIYLLDDKGKDPYIEDEATLWLLHYNLVTSNFASTYNLIFNELRKDKIEFTKENFISFVTRKAGEMGLGSVNKNTIVTDFEVMTKMYLRTETHAKDKEDTFSGLLTELNILAAETRKVEEKQSITYYNIPIDDKNSIPEELIFYSIIANSNLDTSISLQTIEQEYNHVGNVFAISRSGIYSKIESILSNPKFKKYGITYSDYAGVRELQIKKKPSKIEVLNHYYG